jgi:nucleoside phosphorylase
MPALASAEAPKSSAVKMTNFAAEMGREAAATTRVGELLGSINAAHASVVGHPADTRPSPAQFCRLLWPRYNPASPVILILYAFAGEIGAFKRRMKARATYRNGGIDATRGWIGSKEIVAISTGIGGRRAASTARLAMASFGAPELVISAGVAGALTQELRVGELVLANRVLANRDQGPPAVAIAVPDNDLRRFQDTLRAHSLSFTTGPILTVPRVLKDVGTKRSAGEATGASVVDMESAVIAEEAVRRGLRFACVRSILDTADEELAIPELVDGRVRPLAAATFFLCRPINVVRLARMLRALRRAAVPLADALVALSQDAGG